ncbi:MAG TPA: glycosyl hydrolase family 8 [Acetobacteraceae bacterium]|nr:glycosyl hydrolase family 8 [Acetobacteraceae bacterium]
MRVESTGRPFACTHGAGCPRRSVLTAMLGGLSAGTLAPARADAPDDAEWTSFKTRFVKDDGRVIDNANGGVSHSEGQGWGLFFAVAFDDRATFDRIHEWTRQALRRPNDSLHAWRFVPTDRPSVRDLNNATDGDIFIATALSRAGRQWAQPAHLHAAAAITRDILSLLVRPTGSRIVLLPAVQGFETKAAIVVNPSYYVFPMIAELARLVPSAQWDRVQNDGRALIELGRFGKWELPSDWLRINKTGAALSPAPGWPPRFGFDAIRVPLWYTWQGLPIEAPQRAMDRYWSAFPDDTFPAWVNLETDQTAPNRAPLGMVAVAQLTRAAMGLRAKPDLPAVADAAMYYDAALILLSRLAWQERHPA